MPHLPAYGGVTAHALAISSVRVGGEAFTTTAYWPTISSALGPGRDTPYYYAHLGRLLAEAADLIPKHELPTPPMYCKPVLQPG